MSETQSAAQEAASSSGQNDVAGQDSATAHDTATVQQSPVSQEAATVQDSAAGQDSTTRQDSMTDQGDDAGQAQQALPLAEREEPVAQVVGTERETVVEDELVLTGDAENEAAPAASTSAPVAQPADALTAEAPATEESPAPADGTPASVARPRTGSRPAGRTRAPKQDPVLTEAVALAREAVLEPAEAESSVGEHLGVVVHEDRLLTHLFECRLRGYPGWTWYATLARAPRTKHVTVCESGLLSGPGSLLAPDWVPWEERMQAMKEQEAEASEDDPESEEDGEDAAPGSDAGSDEIANSGTEDGASS